MQFDLLAYLADQVRVETVDDIAHVLEFLERTFLVLHLLDLILYANYVLLCLLVVEKVGFPEIYELLISSP